MDNKIDLWGHSDNMGNSYNGLVCESYKFVTMVRLHHCLPNVLLVEWFKTTRPESGCSLTGAIRSNRIQYMI